MQIQDQAKIAIASLAIALLVSFIVGNEIGKHVEGFILKDTQTKNLKDFLASMCPTQSFGAYTSTTTENLIEVYCIDQTGKIVPLKYPLVNIIKK